MWTILKFFIEFVTALLLFYVLVFWLQGMQNRSSLIRDQTCTPCIGRRSFNHWKTLSTFIALPLSILKRIVRGVTIVPMGKLKLREVQ